MLSLIRRFRSDESGATATEYAMLVVFIALAVAVGASALGTGINGLFQTVSDKLTTAGSNIPNLPGGGTP
jgi:pilus assembly protein Flp/PilA